MSPCAPRWEVGWVPSQRCFPGTAPTVPCRLSPGGVERQPGSATAHIPASPLSLVPSGPEKAISAPEVPKPQVGEMERFESGKFPTCCTLEAALTERTASPATEMVRAVTRDRRPPRPDRPHPGGAGGTAVQRQSPAGLARGGGWRIRHLRGLRGGFPLKDLCHPQAPVKSRFSESAWKHPGFPAEGRREGIVRESNDNIDLLIAQIIGGLQEKDRTIEKSGSYWCSPPAPAVPHRWPVQAMRDVPSGGIGDPPALRR